MDFSNTRQVGRELDRYLAEFSDCFGRCDTESFQEVYMASQKTDLQGRSAEPIVFRAGIVPHSLQVFLSFWSSRSRSGSPVISGDREPRVSRNRADCGDVTCRAAGLKAARFLAVRCVVKGGRRRTPHHAKGRRNDHVSTRACQEEIQRAYRRFPSPCPGSMCAAPSLTTPSTN